MKFFFKNWFINLKTYFQAYYLEFKIIYLTHSVFAIWRKSRKRVGKKLKIRMHIFNWFIYLKNNSMSTNLKLKSFTCLCLIKNLSWIFSRNNKQTLHYHILGVVHHFKPLCMEEFDQWMKTQYNVYPEKNSQFIIVLEAIANGIHLRLGMACIIQFSIRLWLLLEFSHRI